MAVHVVGLIVIIFFYLLVLGTGIWASFMSRRKQKECAATRMDMALLGNRSINWLLGVFTMTGEEGHTTLDQTTLAQIRLYHTTLDKTTQDKTTLTTLQQTTLNQIILEQITLNQTTLNHIMLDQTTLYQITLDQMILD